MPLGREELKEEEELEATTFLSDRSETAVVDPLELLDRKDKAFGSICLQILSTSLSTTSARKIHCTEEEKALKC